MAETSKELRNKVIPHARLIINNILPRLTSDRYSDFEITEDLKFKVHSRQAGGYKLSYENPVILINIKDRLGKKPMDFIINIITTFIEELVHEIDYKKNETQIHDLGCSMIEGFLEMKLPESVKQERLRLAKEYDDAVKMQ